MERALAPFGQHMLDHVALLTGEEVLDVGCGTGGATLAAWHRVAPTGRVTGVDISAAMLETARARAYYDAGPDGRIIWLQADAET
jgi:ubiquinone/menaquinone biosynthesis C-methylase UbiE